jgi:hypothetical protein
MAKILPWIGHNLYFQRIHQPPKAIDTALRFANTRQGGYKSQS